MPTTKFRQKILLVLSGILISLVLLEAFFRLGGFLFLHLKEQRNQQGLSQQNTFRILCIGESTTALGGEQSYPSYLEKILNEKSRGPNFQVINAGTPGVGSFDILSALPGYLKEYRPNLVVSMIGINEEYNQGLIRRSSARG